MKLHRIRGFSCLSALRPGHDYLPALDEIAALGGTLTRVFCGALPWAGQSPGHVYDRLPAFLDACRERSLHAYLSYITEAGTGYALDGHVREIEDIVTGRDNVLRECANEPWHGSQGGKLDAARLRDLCARMAGPRNPGAPTADEGPEAKAFASFSDFIGPHLNRGHDGTTRRDKWDMIRRIRELELVSAETGLPVIDNEPIGADEASEFGRREADPSVFFTQGVLDGIIAGGIFHSQSGLWADRLGPNQRLCAEAYMAGSNLWPDDVRPAFRNSAVNGGWEDSPVQWHNVNGCTRAYSGIWGDEGLTIALGIRGDHGVRFGHGWRPVDVLAERPGVTVWRVSRA